MLNKNQLLKLGSMEFNYLNYVLFNILPLPVSENKVSK